jgi:neutral ceramidase
MSLIAGAASHDITPREPMFLYGYPHVTRTATSVHDRLAASALFLHDGSQAVLLISVDVLMLSPKTVASFREEITGATGVPADHVLISATHTHSAPVTAEVVAFRDDPVVPPIDSEYLARVCQGVREAAAEAQANARPARIAATTANARGVGGNRHAKDGPSDPEVGVLTVRDAVRGDLIALDLVYSMHPTVLHEDSTAVSADFPGTARAFLAVRFPGLTTVYHAGPSGNQSPRYFVTDQTFAEADRLGGMLGQAVLSAVEGLRDEDFATDVTLTSSQAFVTLPGRTFPPVEEAEAMLREAREIYDHLRHDGAPRGPVRTAEVAVFGAEERVTLAHAQEEGEIDALLERYTPIEVQVIRVGDTFLVGLPGELFVEYGLAIKARAPGRAFVISLANGDLQGYIVTHDATGYEAGISLFLPEAGDILVAKALEMMERMQNEE